VLCAGKPRSPAFFPTRARARAVGQQLRDIEDIPRVLVVVAHERLAAAEDILLRIVELVRDLKLLAQDDHIRRALV
jgi:hypothetical protein